MELAVVILAAGQGKRFQSATPKILHPLAGSPLVDYPLAIARALKPRKTVVVVSPAAKAPLKVHLNGHGDAVHWAVQQRPLGTGDAVRAAAGNLRNFRGHVLVLAGDVPLLRTETIRRFVKAVYRQGGPGGVLTVERHDPSTYGRIVRAEGDRVAQIVEDRDANAATRAIREINTGIFCCEGRWLFQALQRVQRHNAQREYYLTDIAALAAREGNGLCAVQADDPDEFGGVNSRRELAQAEMLLRERMILHWMDRGVTFLDPASVILDAGVTIGRDTLIEAGVRLAGKTRIGSGCVIGQGAILTDTTLARAVVIKPYCVIDGAVIGAGAQVGPFARLRPETRLDAGSRVGNFVEIKKSRLGRGAKANHLSYLGDAVIGAGSNIGCGTITCNYDGRKKHRTIIGERVFVGSDVALVAPVRIGRDVVIGAGSVITEDVPAGALAIARSRQVVKRGRGMKNEGRRAKGKK